jgi:PAS domain-containing protein
MASESTQLGTWEFNPLTNQLIWSEQCLKIYGLPLEIVPEYDEVRKQNYPEDVKYIDSAMTDVLNPENRSDFNIQYRIFRKTDNEMRWVKVLGKAFFNEAREPERLLGIMLDITEEKIKEEQLKENIELFRTMADNVPAMIWMSGTDRFEDYFNETWLNFRGRTIEQESKEGWLEGVHPEDR